MKSELPSELERLLREELRHLPGYKAPKSLSAGVMAAIQARSQVAWWRQPIWTWALPVRIAFLALLSACVGWLLYSLWQFTSGVNEIIMPAPITHFLAVVSGVADVLGVLAQAVSVVLTSSLQPWVWGIGGAVLFLYLCCLGAGTMFMRLAWRRI